jgi:glyoxylase-like metal-dependent hydrolase (beta-lactamase superfamily II)
MSPPMNEFEPGRLVRVAPGVQRLVAPNPSLMTGPGTNTYLLGAPVTAVIDPGPLDSAHLAAITRAAPRLELVLVTHTHPDHSSGAMRLAELTGARLVGRAPPQNGHQDRSFRPDIEPAQIERTAPTCGALRAIDTPGHASNHVCYLLPAEGLLFSGDHILDGVTPVIAPPDGVMAQYLDSLRRLKSFALEAIAPGHGRVLERPLEVIDGIIGHRERREAKVLSALAQRGRASLDELLVPVYADVRRELHALARQSLEAHLIKLVQDGRCEREGESWLARRGGE